jgi:hypothetical protein
MAPAAGHKNVLFIIHVLLSTRVRFTLLLLFTSFFISSQAAFHRRAVLQCQTQQRAVLVGKTTALRLTLSAILRKSSVGRQDNCFTADTASHPQEVLRQAAEQEKQNATHKNRSRNS